MKKLVTHIKIQIIRGILAVIPIALSVLAVRILYVAIDQKVMGLVDELIGFRVPGLGIVILLTSLYLIGVLTSNVLGKQFFKVIEFVSNKLPKLENS